MKNKKILFIAPKFYNYHQEIINYMENNNAIVTFFSEDIYSSIYRISKKLLPFIAKKIKKKYVTSILENVENNQYDIVFVIRGGILSPKSLETMKKELPNAKFVMYQWDSNKQSNYLPIIKYFDKVQTFDKQDSKQFNIQYLPLFYTDEYYDIAVSNNQKKYDLVFFGAYHSDRLEVIKYIDKLFRENNLEFKYHLYITKLALARFLFTGIIKLVDLKFFKTYTVDTKTIIEDYKKSKAVLDIELNIQNGLTMRTFETLGSNLKLVTTNLNIKKEDFYDPSRIMDIDRNNINIDLDFFKNDIKIDKQFYKYRIKSWLISILD